MSIKSDVLELESIRAELASLNIRRKKLKEKEREAETRIQDYLRSKQQTGVKYQGTAILVEEKEKRASKSNKIRDADAKCVLERYGITEPDRVLKELMEARKGEPIPNSKLKIKKYKNRN
uniref:Host-nuclease inhibitor protein n=1 Tax=viral metagenome TaxID=1070528 RepID=A0A6C0EM10_9ZZZZ